MTKKYQIRGMTCGGCVASVKKQLEQMPEVNQAHIQLEDPQAILNFNSSLQTEQLQEAIGRYQITELQETTITSEQALPEKSISTYKPLLLIVSFIAGVSLLAQYPFSDFSIMLWMRHFMAGFFIVFAFFKLLNLEGFANSYSMYDIIAERWKSWGYIYPFLELGLGILYLINIAPFTTNILTIIILGISSIGVIRSNLKKEEIKCACLGDVFNLPMSTVTIVEDLSMVGMAVGMLLIG
ncbi:MAG: heavy-metal-associated domain-containing protein [Saprospiraceae bacterium]